MTSNAVAPTASAPAPAPAPVAWVGCICIDCHDPVSLAGWWRQLLGGTTQIDGDGDVHLDGGPVPILFLGVPEPRSTKNRLHLDLAVSDYDAAVARAIELGATPADEIYAGWRWRVLRDPEGNEFCILRPTAAEQGE